MGFQSIIQSDFRLVLPTLESESVDGCFTDPPFNINLTPQRKTHGKIANDALTPEEFAGLLHDAFGEMYRLLKPNRVAWICCNWQCLDVVVREAKCTGFEVNNCVVWVKNNWGLGYHFRPQHEFIAVLFKGTPPVPAEAVSNVWNVERLNQTVHPTEKPIKLVQKALRQYNQEGDTILDPFAGSFSTCAAAKSLGMGYIGIELDKNWFEIGKARLEGGIVSTVNAKGRRVERIEGNALLDIFNE
jgi:DNA modification methylase